MPRRGSIPKREVLPDHIYGSTIVTKLINQVMYDGKRGTAQKVCYQAFEAVAEKTGKEATEVFEAAMNNIMPVLEVKARRVGGATYQVLPPARREDPGRAPVQRDHRRLQQHRRFRQAQGGHAQDGRGQQGVRALSLVTCRRDLTAL